MLLILYVLDSLFFVTPKSKCVLMHVWRHMLLTLWFVDSLFLRRPRVSVSQLAQRWVGRYMEKDKGRERVREGGRGVLENYFFFRFLRAARDAFFFTYTAC